MKTITFVLFAACVIAAVYAYPSEVQDEINPVASFVAADTTGERVKRQYGYGGYGGGYGRGGYGGYGGYGGGYRGGYGGGYGRGGYGGYGGGYGGRGFYG